VVERLGSPVELERRDTGRRPYPEDLATFADFGPPSPRRPLVPVHARGSWHGSCFSKPPRRSIMYYGIGGTIVLILLILFILGRI
jgi:hypothetical protein